MNVGRLVRRCTHAIGLIVFALHATGLSDATVAVAAGKSVGTPHLRRRADLLSQLHERGPQIRALLREVAEGSYETVDGCKSILEHIAECEDNATGCGDRCVKSVEVNSSSHDGQAQCDDKAWGAAKVSQWFVPCAIGVSLSGYVMWFARFLWRVTTQA